MTKVKWKRIEAGSYIAEVDGHVLTVTAKYSYNDNHTDTRWIAAVDGVKVGISAGYLDMAKAVAVGRVTT